MLRTNYIILKGKDFWPVIPCCFSVDVANRILEWWPWLFSKWWNMCWLNVFMRSSALWTWVVGGVNSQGDFRLQIWGTYSPPRKWKSELLMENLDFRLKLRWRGLIELQYWDAWLFSIINWLFYKLSSYLCSLCKVFLNWESHCIWHKNIRVYFWL